MENNSQAVGKELKKIRENKGYTQQYVAKEAMSRSTYTKLESDLITPSVTKYFQILNNLDMSHPEFSYICNQYRLKGKEEIVYHFKKIAINTDLTILYRLKKLSEDYLLKHEDNIVTDILTICDALINLSKTNDLSQAAPHAEKVWKRVSKLDKWYITELRLLNNILFFFDFETSLFISQRALKELENYNHFNEATDLKLAFSMNLIYLLMENKNFEQAFNEVEPLIDLSKVHSKFRMLAVLYVRKGIIMQKINDTSNSETFIQKGYTLLDAIEDNSLKEELKKEVTYYSESLKVT